MRREGIKRGRCNWTDDFLSPKTV